MSKEQMNPDEEAEALFVPLSTDPKEVWDEWYSKAWSKDKARKEFLKNPKMSNDEFAKLLGNLYKPGDLSGKAIAFKLGSKTIKDEDRGFFETWLMAKSNDLLAIAEEKMID